LTAPAVIPKVRAMTSAPAGSAPPNVVDRLPGAALKHPRLVLLAAVLLVWGHSICFGFVWDDYFFIETNEAIRSLRNIPRMFTDLQAQAAYADGFLVFRPLRTIHYALLYWLGGGVPRPALFHAANLAWHAAAVCLVFTVASRLLRGSAGADKAVAPRNAALSLIAGLAYAVHPVLSETVCWAKGLDDLMAAVFTLLATSLLLNWRGDARSYAGTAAAFLAAVYSKESAVPWVAFAGLLFWLFHGRSFWRSAALTAPLALLTLLALWHRHAVMGRSSQTEPISGSYAQTLLDMFPTVTTYARLGLGIPPFCIDYSYLTGGHAAGSVAVLTGAVILTAAVGVVLWALSQPRWRAAGLGGAWFFLFMLPVSNLVPMMQYLAERFLYLPLAGVILAAVSALNVVPRPALACRLALGVGVLWAAGAWTRSWIWRDEATLFVRTYQENPWSVRVERNAVAGVLKQPHMRNVFELTPRSGDLPVLNLAPPEKLRQADWPRVLASVQQLTELFPTNSFAIEAAGIGFARAGRPVEGAQAFETAARLAPNRPSVWGNLGQACFDSRQYDRAVPALERCLELDPGNLSALKTLGAAHWQRSDFVRAATIYEQLTRLEPSNAEHTRWLNEARAKSKP
jgi:hypothetical protein